MSPPRSRGSRRSSAATCLPKPRGRESNVERSEGSGAAAGGASIWAKSGGASIQLTHTHTHTSVHLKCARQSLTHAYCFTGTLTFVRFQPEMLADLVSTPNAGQKNPHAAKRSRLASQVWMLHGNCCQWNHVTVTPKLD